MPPGLIHYEDLVAITGRKMPSAQARWFKTEFGVDVPQRTDRKVILSWAMFEALQAQKLGLVIAKPMAPSQRPTVCSPFE